MPKLPALAALALLTLVGCQPETPSPPEASSTDVELLAAGFFVHPRGIVRPYCHGVLTDERFVLTAERCVSRVDPRELSFAVGGDGGYEMPVTERVDSGDGLVRLRLAAPLERGVPAFEPGPTPRTGDRLSVIAFTHTAAQEETPDARRYLVEVVEVRNDVLVADLRRGEPGCHGDFGAAAYDGGALVAIVSGTEAGGPTHPTSEVCRTRLLLTPLATANVR
ncbi:MAG: hypothetical protein RLO52_24550 [Sandaracinaceae bacterium]